MPSAYVIFDGVVHASSNQLAMERTFEMDFDRVQDYLFLALSIYKIRFSTISEVFFCGLENAVSGAKQIEMSLSIRFIILYASLIRFFAVSL